MKETVEVMNKEILDLLKKAEHPIPTREIALRIGHAWHTTLIRLLRLQIAGKVDSFKAGHTHLWLIKK